MKAGLGKVSILESALKECRKSNIALLKRVEDVRKELENTNRLKDEFLKHINHELRTPVAVIKGSVDTLRKYPEMEINERNSFINLISSECERLSGMIEDMLYIAEIEEGRLTLNKQIYDLSLIVQYSLDLLAGRIKAKKIIVKTRAARRSYLSFVDAARLTDVFNNIINNAINYTQENGVIKILFSVRKTGAAAYNVVRVVDSGQGLPRESLKDIFKSFYRTRKFLRASDRESYARGIGLGLYLSKKIVDLHNGLINASSRQGRGSVFSVCLPVCELPGE